MKVLILVALFFSSTAIHANDKDDWPITSGMYASLAMSETLDEKRQKLAQIEEEIKTQLIMHRPHGGEYFATEFNRHNSEWLSYVSSTCSLVGQMSGAGSPWQSFRNQVCQSNMIDQRLFNLTNSRRCIKKHVKNEQYYDIPACLYQSFSVKY